MDKHFIMTIRLKMNRTFSKFLDGFGLNSHALYYHELDDILAPSCLLSDFTVESLDSLGVSIAEQVADRPVR